MGAVKNFFQEVVDTYENDPNHKTQSIVDIHEALDETIGELLQKGYHAEDIGVVALVIASKIHLSEGKCISDLMGISILSSADLKKIIAEKGDI